MEAGGALCVIHYDVRFQSAYRSNDEGRTGGDHTEHSGDFCVEWKLELMRQHGYPVGKLTDLIQNDNDTDTIVYTSRAFQPMVETFSRRYAFMGPSVAKPVTDSVEKRRPLGYISLGTVLNRRVDFYRNCFAALGGEDLDVVLSAGERTDLADLGPVPGNFRVERRVDQMAVQPRRRTSWRR